MKNELFATGNLEKKIIKELLAMLSGSVYNKDKFNQLKDLLHILLLYKMYIK